MAKASYVVGFLLAALFLIGGIQFCACRNSSSGACIQRDRNALLKFKGSLQDPSNLLSSWVGEDCCHWKGVSCGENTGHVIKLDLRFDDECGSYYSSDPQLGARKVNISLVELKHLEYLDLSGTNFQDSEIPKFFGSLNKLRYLNLSCAHFSGKIPHQLGNLTNLEVLDLSSRSYVRPAYADNFQWASSLLSLQHLDMSGVDLGSAHNLMEVLTRLPSLQNLQLSECGINNTHFQHALLNSTFIALQNMSFLRVLDISDNSFNSSVPLWLGNLKSLVTLDLGGSEFYSIEGGLSSLINNYCHLKSLDLSGNRFHGEAFGTGQNLSRCVMHSLESLSLGGNEIGGQFPNWLAQLRGLQHLDLSSSLLSGVIPNTLQNMSFLRVLDISDNSFNSSVPLWLGNLKSLVTLDLGGNEFDSIEGGLSLLINNYCHLKSLDLSGNRFHGEAFGTGQNLSRCVMHSLESLSLAENEIGWQLPNWLGQLRGLQDLDLSYSQLSGVIPNTLQNMSFLKVLDISQNSFNSSVPLWLGNLKSLVTLYLSWNKFDSIEGGLSSLINNYCHLKSLDLSGNRFHGEAFGTGQNLSRCVMHSLESLSLGGNEIGGQFPNWLAQLRGLQHLDLSSSLLSGVIPNTLQNMSFLRVLDISDNSFNSSVPLWLGNLKSLVTLDLGGNEFDSIEGGLSLLINNYCHLKSLDLSGNRFHGEAFGTGQNLSRCVMHSLESLSLAENEIGWQLPNWLGQLRGLQDLDLSYSQLSGVIPNTLQNMSFLKVLDISQNSFNSSVPLWLGNLKSLVTLYLSWNKFDSIEGGLSSLINNYCHLKSLDLSGNRFHGEAFGTGQNLSRCVMHSLESLSLTANEIGWQLPNWLGQLRGLQHLDLSYSLLQGPIPSSLCNLSNLRELDVGGNSLEGTLSEIHFSNLSRLKSLYIDDNYNLSFKVSSDWIPPFSLQDIHMQNCKIEGSEFPQWLHTQEEVTYLSLRNASISGIFPMWLQSMPLSSLDLSENGIKGSIPNSLCKLNDLRFLDLSRNMLHGQIPDCWADSLNIDFIDLSSNKLSGTIPVSIGNLPSLSWLLVNNNSLSGKLPLALINCSSLISLDLGENNLSGIIPTWIGEKFWDLEILRLRENMFTGTIPLSLCRLSQLRILDLGYNSLMGRIPLCFSNLSGMMMIDSPDLGYYANWNYEVVGQVMKGQLLEYTRSVLSLVANMDLSSNKLVGHIPDELTTLVGLRGLNLSHNNLSGSIPWNIGNITSLESLDLSDNQLSGTIPNSMSIQTSLNYLNLSHNKLSGKIPKGNQLQTLTDPSIYAGNQLCGDPLPNKCPGDEEHVPPPMSIEPENEEHGESKSEKFWFYFVVSCGYATGLWGVIGILLVKKNWRIAYFRFADKAKDWVLVMGAVQVARLKRKMERNNNGSV